MLPFFALALLAVTPSGAGSPKPAKYPLRVHVLASDETHKTPRMNPGDSVVCDDIEGMLDSISPNPGGPITLTGLSGDPCSSHPELVRERSLNVQDSDPAFSGEGRADLVSPPAGTQGLKFRYDNCSRVRVLTGFQSLPARWKRPGQRLEVLIPSDEIPVNGRPLRPVKCSFSVAMQDFIYLLMPSGRLIEVSQDVYWNRPGLRAFLSGTAPVVQPRAAQYTVSAHPKQ